MNLLIILHFNCVYAIDARNERVLVILEMSMELGQNVTQQYKLFLHQGFHDKASIMTEEKETTASSCCLSCLED